MNQKQKKLWPYIIVLCINFYLLPFLAQDTGTGMLLMLCIIPFIALIAAVTYGIRNGFCIMLPIATLILFMPTIFIHYNSSAWIYGIVYGVIVLAGNWIGRALNGNR